MTETTIVVAKSSIKQYFESRHGETIYPSDIADALSMGYDRAVRLIGELENDGKIRRCPGAPK